MFSCFNKKNLKHAEEKAVHEQTSPLFRIMSLFDDEDPQRRKFNNNICAFHIGNGYILSVAHSLRSEASILSSLPEVEYQTMRNSVAGNIRNVFDAAYTLDTQTNKRYLNNPINQNILTQLSIGLKTANYDTRWITLYDRGMCKPFLIFQFRENLFYQDSELADGINQNHRFHEPKLFRHTFLLEVELVEAFYSVDYALYRIVGNESLIQKIPSFDIDYEVIGSKNNLFCLQSAPIDNLGRLLNTAEMEGILDHWNLFPDSIGGNYSMDGLRYLIKGYFRFGSSGAPYLKYDLRSKAFKINAIQSEASPIQLTINNNRNGNFQYINAIASPIKNIKEDLERILTPRI